MKVVRLMLPAGIGPIPRNGFALCIGNDVHPKRKCWWRIIDFYTDTTEVHDAMQQLLNKGGNSVALVRMSYEWIKIIGNDGREIYCGHGFKKKQKRSRLYSMG